MSKVITLSGLQHMGAPDGLPIGGSCAAMGAYEVLIGTTPYCVYPIERYAVGEQPAGYVEGIYKGLPVYAPQAVVDAGLVEGKKTYPKLLNFGIAAGAGALVGLLVASSKSKKFVPRAAGAGAGAALAAIILVMMWPKSKGA